MKKVVIYRAADAFLYLPTYIAEHTEIFRTIDKTLEVKFRTPGGREPGDVPAIRAMIAESHKTDTIPIALCDPLVIFNSGVCTPLQPEDLRLIGALITKPCFWCVNGAKDELSASEIKNHFKDFNKVIFYNQKLATGNSIGRGTKE